MESLGEHLFHHFGSHESRRQPHCQIIVEVADSQVRQLEVFAQVGRDINYFRFQDLVDDGQAEPESIVQDQLQGKGMERSKSARISRDLVHLDVADLHAEGHVLDKSGEVKVSVFEGDCCGLLRPFIFDDDPEFELGCEFGTHLLVVSRH